ncbi:MULTISPECIES: ImmA/IrrE family metallo-endopeptidase [Dermacoccus]|uniref:ImmA/IrrE family metallo-endopeptidase n=1 Tax=Dermacoccus TaxID=57495 RepID=UPI001CA6F7D4|nr:MULTISPECIES: ImmA/IrrE family metallo-endopeptidase [Dermacoccus]MBZ4496954.1 ImmA/IrrE family metallo-endopeptidase [Dermacoccus sp. Tok2021]MCT1986904.1 ImmA/IrrE family metallo-endopeptidase [Dermacoccus abyssi]
MRHNPWRTLREQHSEWHVHFVPALLGEALGITRWGDRTIWLAHDLTQVQRRCVLEHERQHILRGPAGQGDDEERAVEMATARELVTLDDLVDAARWSTDLRQIADHCWVTLDVLMCRLRHLHPAERFVLLEGAQHHRCA